MTSMADLTGAPLNGVRSIRGGGIIWDLDQALTTIERGQPQIDTFIDVVTNPARRLPAALWFQTYLEALKADA